MKKAVIYARYSSDSQTEQSIEGQLRVCREYAQNNEILIVDTYIDRAMTGTNDNRAAFQKRFIIIFGVLEKQTVNKKRARGSKSRQKIRRKRIRKQNRGRCIFNVFARL